MTELLEQIVETDESAESAPVGAVAGWPTRAAAFAVDVLCGATVLAVVLLTLWAAPRQGWLWWCCVVLAALLILAMAVNRIVLPAITGRSLGRSMFGIEVVRRDGGRPGVGRLLARELAHLIDTIPPIGWFWPLWDARGRTLADIATGTEVHRLEDAAGVPVPTRRGRAAIVAVAAAVLAVAVAGAGYFAVNRPERAVQQARAEIAEQGPKIVSQVLSYGANSANEDFARAQQLVTDDYRPQLVIQQEAIAKAGPVDNEYWSTNSAVLSAEADRAEMLMLMHGQRGTGKEQRLITATLRVSFEKRADRWQVSNIVVLAQPNTARAGS